MSSVLALDQGTTSSRALVVRADGRVLGHGHRALRQHFPEPGWVEHDAEEIFAGTVAAAREALAAAGERPAAIGITNQRETVVLWDRASLEPIGRALVWQDRRTAARCRELADQGIEPMLRERTGLVADPYFSATKLEWMLRDPALRRRAERGELAAGTIDAWLVSRLTGGRIHATDHTNASRTLLYNLDSRAWDDELLGLFSVPRALLPEIVASSGVIGESDPEHFGTPLPIAAMAGDQQASLFGLGCTARGTAKNTYGTGAFMLVHAGDARPAPGRGVLATAACGPRGEPAYALEGSIFIAGAAIQWLRDGLGLLETAAESEEVARSVADTAGVHFVPAFVGLGTPHWEPDARGTITGLTRGTSKAHLVRSALESMAFGSAELLEAMGGSSVRTLRVDGGAAANGWLMQFQADILGQPVERPDVVETTALGAAGLAGLAAGVWRDADELMASRRFTRFVPRMAEADRVARRAEWARAVQAALAWAKAGGPSGTNGTSAAAD